MATVTVTPGYSWSSGEIVTPAKMNLAAAPTVTVTDTIPNNSVTTVKILDGAVTNAKLATGLDASKLTTGTLPIARIADGAVTNDKLSLTANDGEIKKALNSNNAPPIYACRAWVNFNGQGTANLSGTYARTGTTVTVTALAHGLIVGNVVRLVFSGGTPTTAATGVYTVTQVNSDDAFQVTTSASGTSSGGTVVLERRLIRAAANVSSVSATASGEHVVNFAVAMPSANYAIVEGGAANASIGTGAKEPTPQAFYVTTANTPINTVAVFA
jgi:hypothetical protein